MRAPTAEDPSHPAGNRNLVSGGHIGRPYEKTGGGTARIGAGIAAYFFSLLATTSVNIAANWS